MAQRKLEDPNVEGFKIVSNIVKHFWNRNKCAFVNSTGGTGDFEGGYVVWPASIAVQAVIDAARINKNYTQMLHETMAALDKYFDPKTKGFSPTSMGGEFYSDDSAQAVICYITAYEVTHDKKFLDRAVEGTKFLMGMADQDQGGVRWKMGQAGVNAVSTAECGMAAAMLAKYVQPNNSYIEFGDYCYQFIFNKMLNNGLIADGLEGDEGKFNPMKWTYNQGTPLTLCAHMFTLTKDEKYFNAAHDLARSATDTNTEIFDRETGDHNVRFYRDSLKFYQLLAAGFADYLMVFGDRDEQLSQKILNTVNRHLYLIFNFMVLPNQEAMYHGNLKIYDIDEARAEIFNKMTGENKVCSFDREERKGGKEKGDFATNLMNMGSAARVFFQSARIIPQTSF